MRRLLLLGSLFVGCAPAPRTEIAEPLRDVIAYEMESKEIPSFAIALVDDQTTLLAEGFGGATADTAFRVGSVSKLFTDIAVMQLVERGEVDLDEDIRTYVPELQLDNPYEKPVTLRQLMSHTSGLVREPPVGHYFDPDEPSLGSTVQSLSGSKLVYEPGSRRKYSNAGIAIAGYALERTQNVPFADYVRDRVLDPLGMGRSDFSPSKRLKGDLAKGVMWTYDGRTFEAPNFQLGMAPAGSLYATIRDLGTFMSVLFRGGGGVLRPDILESMYEPQFTTSGSGARRGLGFEITELDGRRALGHGGAIYGFSTELLFLPDEKLGVVAVASKDSTNGVVERIVRYALASLLAARDGESPPVYEPTEPLPPGRARKLAGTYRSGDESIRLEARGNRLFVERGSRLEELRLQGEELVVDSPLGYGPPIDLGSLEKLPDRLPPEAPDRFRGLIGEYGWDHDILYILERDGLLYALIEWFEFDRLAELKPDRFAFPDNSLYEGEDLVFERDGSGRATAVTVGGVRFERRAVGTEQGETFKIEPLRPMEELRKLALAAEPPQETGEFREPDFVEPSELDPTIRLDIRYATTNNFMGSVFYRQARAFLQRPAAEALVRAHRSLREKGYGILIHDAYRPWYVTKMFYDATPDDQKIFVADPKSGSRHNRGCAVDVTLYDLGSGNPVTMVGGYDEFSDRSFPFYPGGTSRQRFLRRLLRREMEAQGFDVYEYEWWHFDYQSWEHYPISNKRFEEL